MTVTTKVLGADFELANAMESRGASLQQNVYEASRRLLDEIDGLPRGRGTWGGTAIEWGRRFLAGNGGSAYIDSDHLEINLPEHTRAFDHARHVHAGFRLAQRARAAAQAKVPRGTRIELLATVSDTRKSWGAHLNVCVSRRLWDDMFGRRPHLAGLFAAHLVTASIYTGQGQVGAGNDRPACEYQLAQRPDFFESFTGWQTTHQRPVLNLRDEAHAGKGLARMHVIYFDNNLAPVANVLKAGATQLVLAMLEAGWCDPGLLLDDPLSAGWQVSRDVTMQAPLRLAARGKSATAIEVQMALAEMAGEFVASGECGDAVPDGEAVVALWRETLEMAKRRDVAALARRADWALKYLVLSRQIGRRGLSWRSAEVKALDLRYASLDPDEGLFLQLAKAGQVEAMPADEEIDAAADEPPTDTRAYLRAQVLRRHGDDVTEMDWDRVRFRSADGYRYTGPWLGMPEPARWGKEESDAVLAKCATAAELAEAVGEPTWPEKWAGWGATPAWGRRGAVTTEW